MKTRLGSMSMMIHWHGWCLILSLSWAHSCGCQPEHLHVAYLPWTSHNRMTHIPNYLHVCLLSMRCPYAFTFGMIQSQSISVSLSLPSKTLSQMIAVTYKKLQDSKANISLFSTPAIDPSFSYSQILLKIHLRNFMHLFNYNITPIHTISGVWRTISGVWPPMISVTMQNSQIFTF